MAETRWHRIKQWFIARDPDEVAREEFRRTELTGSTPVAVDRIDLTRVDAADQDVDDRHPEPAS